MNQSHQSDGVEQEASMWAARLRGRNVNDADRAALGQWLEADSEHGWLLGRYRELSAQLDEQLGPALESLAVVQAGRRRRRWRRSAAVLAAAALAAVAFFVVAGRRPALTTRTAERHTEVLPDGSRLELNALTSLTFDFRRDERRVRLARGEVLFSVAKDPTRPFVVETPQGVVRVTGTVFDVRVNDPASQVEVTVLEGTVRVRAGHAATEEVMAPGFQAVMASKRAAVRALPENTAQNVVAWQRGQVIFDDARLVDAIGRFAAYQTRTIRVDPDVADLRLGGRYDLDDLDGLLRTIGRLLPVQVVQEPDGTVRITGK